MNGYETNGAKTGFIGSTVYGSLFGERGISENKFLSAELTYSWVNDWNFIEISFHFRQMLNRQISIFAWPKLDVAADKIDKTKESTSRLLGISAEAGAQYDFSDHLFAEVKYSVGVRRILTTFFLISIMANGIISASGPGIVFKNSFSNVPYFVQ